VVISMLTARSLVRPLAALQQAVTALGSGQLGARAAVPVVREYALLAEGMNAMAEALAGLVRRIQRAGVQVTSSATQITAAARQLQTSVGEQTATTAQVGASVAEISATTQQLAGTIAHAAAAADASAGIAGHSVSDIAALTGSMRQLLTSTANLGGRFSLLSAKAQGIGSVVTTIAKVADQTNLLSLNAAIEAEKAGEAGLGFAVVAREIRRLADQSAIATADIEELIREMQGAVVGGVTGMDAFTHEVRVQADAVAAFGSKLEELIRQAPELAAFHPASVNTVRIPTLFLGGRALVYHPFLRTGIGPSIVDNGGSGGILAGIDPATGTVETAGRDESGIYYEKHPDTGLVFRGFQVPQWPELLALADQLCRIVPTNRYTGWDFALTAQGWILVEANDRGQFVGFQMMTGKGCRRELEAILAAHGL